MPYIKDIKHKDNTRDPKVLTDMAKRFNDPSDKRYSIHITFKDVPVEFLNLLIRYIDSPLGVKCLMPQNFIYEAYYQGTSTAANAKSTYGYDLFLNERISFLPINQDLDIDTRFIIHMKNESGENPQENGLYSMTILSDNLKPVKELPKSIIPFNRRVLLGYLRPNEYLEASYYVKEAPEKLSIYRRTRWSRSLDNPLFLEVETQLNDRPDKLMFDISKYLIERFDTLPDFLEIELPDEDIKSIHAALVELNKTMLTSLKGKFV